MTPDIFVGVELVGRDSQGGPKYRMNVCTNEKVPPYGPSLNTDTFTNMTEFRNLIMAKSLFLPSLQNKQTNKINNKEKQKYMYIYINSPIS